jgi:predicted TIM-barrel fold metal-dependent hydrolase
MLNRRDFLVGASTGILLSGCRLCSMAAPTPQALAAPPRRPVKVGGRRVKTVDVHCHVHFPEITAFLKGTPVEKPSASQTSTYTGYNTPLLGGARLELMDKQQIDVQAVSINPYWYSADEELATRFMDFLNQKLAEMLQAAPEGRFAGFASVALQFPELAAKQMEGAMKMGLKGAAIGGSVNGEELSLPKYEVFWAKAEELQAPIFMHPQGSVEATGIDKRVRGTGYLTNVIGNPLETTFFLSHMIFGGVLERHPGLKICCAHGGGFLPSYADRMDHGCWIGPESCQNSPLKKHPTEYLKQIYVDSLVFTPEALRHLVAVMGSSHIMLGTDYPFPWTTSGGSFTLGPVEHVFATPGLTDAQRFDILGGAACKWLGLPQAS